MNSTETFIICTFAAALLIFAIIVSNPSIRYDGKAAHGFYIFCVVSSLIFLTFNILFAFKIISVNETYSLILRLFIYRFWIVVGAGTCATLIIILNAFGVFKSRLAAKPVQSFITSPYLIRGLCFSVSITFFAFEIGKLMHDAEIRKFFLDSGHTVWFMYFIMIAELLGATGLFISRIVLPAALGLSVIMLGAIYTHYHNDDPFSESLDAFHLLILLICIIVLKINTFLRIRMPSGSLPGDIAESKIS